MKIQLQHLFSIGIISLALLSMNNPSVAQQAIDIKNMQAQMSKGTQPCYVVNIPQSTMKDVQQDWIKKLQEGNKAKVQNADHELVMTGGVISQIMPDSVNIYSLIIPTDSAILLYFLLEKDSVFFAPKDDQSDLVNMKIDNSIKKYLRAFAAVEYTNAVNGELKDQEKVLKDLNNDLEKLEKDEENLKKDNSSLENDIDKSEREIKEIEAKLDLKNQEILRHAAAMETISQETEKKAAQDRAKELEKEKKQVDKSLEKEKGNISSCKSKIEKNNKDIEKCRDAQEQKKEEITNQENVITQVQTKLNGIK